MDPRAPVPSVTLHLTSLAILSPTNSPLLVHSFTGKQDELRHYHLAHAALDVVEERIVMTSTPTKPADSYLGMLFCMEDMAFYGFQTTTRLRMILSVALVDAMIKDGDIIAIFRAVHQLVISAIHNPFLSLPPSFQARKAPRLRQKNGPLPSLPPDSTDASTDDTENQGDEASAEREAKIVNVSVPNDKMFSTGPDEIDGEWLRKSRRFQAGIRRIGELLSGGRI